MADEVTKLDRVLLSAKNHRALVWVLLAAIILIGVGQVSDALTRIGQFFRPQHSEHRGDSSRGDAERVAALTSIRRLGIPFTRDAFLDATEKGRYETIKLFLQAGMDPNVRTPDS